MFRRFISISGEWLLLNKEKELIVAEGSPPRNYTQHNMRCDSLGVLAGVNVL